jgi:ribosomal protein S12 methylthiotransferase
VKQDRWNRLMQHQRAISRGRLKRRVGRNEQIIIDQPGVPGSSSRAATALNAAGEAAKGRSKGDAPQIDGTVFVSSRRPLRVGEIATVKIERAGDYDLYGSVVGY